VERRLRTEFYPSNIYPLLISYGEGKREKCAKVMEYLREAGVLGFKGKIKLPLVGC
jgi:hypothetical protein